MIFWSQTPEVCCCITRLVTRTVQAYRKYFTKPVLVIPHGHPCNGSITWKKIKITNYEEFQWYPLRSEFICCIVSRSVSQSVGIYFHHIHRDDLFSHQQAEYLVIWTSRKCVCPGEWRHGAGQTVLLCTPVHQPLTNQSLLLQLSVTTVLPQLGS